jgi:transposase
MREGRPVRPVAEELGINYLRAKWWLNTWKSTGQTTAKKGRGTRHSVFDDHLEYVRAQIQSNPDVTLRELSAALAASGFECEPRSLQINLSRHRIVLKSVVDARRKNGQDKVRVSHTPDG